MITTRSVPKFTALLLAVALCTAAVSGQQQGSLASDPTGDAPTLNRVLEGDSTPDIIISPNHGSAVSRVLDGATLADLGSGFPFGPGFGGGVRMAAGDLTGDGVVDIVSAMGPGGGLVKLLNGIDASEIGGGFPFGPGFGGGVNVAVGEFSGDGRLDIVTTQASGGGSVTVFNGVNYATIFSLQPFGASYTGGVNVATGDVDADGVSDIIAAQANGNVVSIVSGASRMVILSGVPFGGGGVFVAAGDVNGDGRAEVMAAPGTGAGPVLVYDVHALAPITSFLPYGAGFGGGVRLAATDLNGDGRVEILTVPGPGSAPTLKVFDGATFANINTVLVYPPTFTEGVFVAVPAATGIRFTSAPATTFTAGTAGTFTVQVAGSPRATAITQAGTLPAGVTFTNNADGTATLAGTPGASAGGSYAFSISASNGVDAPIAQTFTLTVNQAPAITSASAVSFSEGAAGTFAITSTGFPLATVAVTGPLPSGMTFTANSDGTGALAGTPAAGTSGTHPLTITASNGVGSAASQSFVLTIASTPVFTSAASATFVAGSAATFTVTTSAAPAVTSLTRTGALPAGVTYTDHGNGTATLAGTATASGIYPLTFSASNGGAPVQQSFTLTVNQAPAITSASSATMAQGTPGTFTVTSSGFPAAALVLTGALPAGVTFTSNGDGTATLAGTPAAGSGGAYPLSFNASNGVGAPAVQSFTLNVSAPPAFTSATSTTFVVGSAGSFSVTTTGGPTAAAITRTGTLPGGVTFTDNGNGTATIAGTPSAGTGGSYQLTLTATNGVGSPAQQSFTLTVNQAPAITSANSASFTTGTAGTFSITATGFPAATLSHTGTLPTGVTFTNNGNGTATLAGTPAAGTAGAYALTISATNAAGSALAQSFTLTIVAAAVAVANDDSYSNGVGNTQYSVGAGAPSTPAIVVAGSVLTNDSGAGTLTAGPASIASANGGQVTMSSNGSFLYTPAVGFAGPSDAFTYTVTDANSATDTAVATINMSGVVWYVNAAAAGGGDGRSHSPFNAMPAAATAAQTNQIIYVHAGSPAGATVLKASQTLWGAGAAYALNGLTIPATAAPTLQGTVTLANGVLVNSLAVNGGGSAAIAATGLTGTEWLNAVSITGGSSGLSLTNLAGTFSMVGGSISGVTAGADVLMSGGAGTVTIGAAIVNTGGRSIDIQNRTGGTVTFSGAISDTGTGILLNANTGATIAFTGGLALSTGDNPAFTATAGGTITATQNNTSIVNTIATIAGTALNVTDTSIGAAGLTFRSISAGSNGLSPGVGIVLDNTGLAVGNGGLTVTGNGTAASGGSIWKKAGANGQLTGGVGIYLNSTRNASFSWLDMYHFENSAIVGRNVHGFFLSDSVVDSAGDTAGVNEGPIVFGLPGLVAGANGLQGVGRIRNTLVSGGVQNNVSFHNQSGDMTLTIESTTGLATGCLVAFNSSSTGENGLLVQLEGTATGTVDVRTCFLRGNRTAALMALASESSNLTVVADGLEVAPTAGLGNQGIVVTNGDDAQLTATIANSTFGEFPGSAIRIGQASGVASALSLLRATISNNNMFEPSAGATAPSVAAYLSSSSGQAARTRLLISTNRIRQRTLQPGIVVSTPDSGTSPVVDVTVVDNHVDMDADPATGLRGSHGIVVGATQPAASVCANVITNSAHWYPITVGEGGGILAEQAAGGTFRLERGSEGLGTSPAVVLNTNNAAGPYGPSTTSVVGALTVVENGSCQLPTP